MRLSKDQIRQAAGLTLSEAQANALDTFTTDSPLKANARTLNTLARLGLAHTVVDRGPRGGRRVRTFLTAEGIRARRFLHDACEYGADMAEQARLLGKPACDLYYKLLESEGLR